MRPATTTDPHPPRWRGRWLGPALVLGTTMIVLLLTNWAARVADVPVSALTRDPAAVARQPFYYGLLSNLGVLFWAGAGGALTIGCLALRRRPGRAPESLFLGYFALTTWLLVLDDLFMIHEEVYRLLLPGPEEVVLALHLLLLLGGLLGFHRIILRSDWLWLAMALGFFAASVLIDVAIRQPSPRTYLLEDGAKLLGIVSWACYFGTQTIRLLTPDP